MLNRSLYASWDEVFLRRRLIRATVGVFLSCLIFPALYWVIAYPLGMYAADMDCNIFTKKFSRAIGFFSKTDICIANRDLYANVLWFIVSYSLLYLYIFFSVLLRSGRGLLRGFRAGNLKRAVFPAFCLSVVAFSVYSYSYGDAGFRIDLFKMETQNNIITYAWLQISFIMVVANFFSFAASTAIYIELVKVGRPESRPGAQE